MVMEEIFLGAYRISVYNTYVLFHSYAVYNFHFLFIFVKLKLVIYLDIGLVTLGI